MLHPWVTCHVWQSLRVKDMSIRWDNRAIHQDVSNRQHETLQQLTKMFFVGDKGAI